MRIAGSFALLALASLPVVGAAQSSPTADAFRRNIAHAEKNLVASAEEMPADKYSYKPTPAQMTFGEIVLHVADDNDENRAWIAVLLEQIGFEVREVADDAVVAGHGRQHRNKPLRLG